MKLLIILITLFLASASTFGKTTIVLTTHNLPPYSHYIGKMLSGSAVEVVECAFKPMSEYTLQIKVVPWKRAQTLVIQNEADGFFAASKNPTRDNYATMIRDHCRTKLDLVSEKRQLFFPYWRNLQDR
ncbi:hypothetical protein [Neptuniibacter caesariensis]|uniref:Solute-binding protein family 3/N-terminal domain-containing protein n=1 Tax=Neptuniibacter caesariensis TaxID=207954 RepID=A0A7U8C4G9_NEPCE|nr:hypothetical protein [Neptuniibacter caesariensis]EAR60601.1 hypothetical protein MED92_09361 [Oceanospirillum sp. MED92] [Neptuniibacter caesariensis]